MRTCLDSARLARYHGIAGHIEFIVVSAKYLRVRLLRPLLGRRFSESRATAHTLRRLITSWYGVISVPITFLLTPWAMANTGDGLTTYQTYCS
jgi:hypothetical protein